jgi:transcription elongation factor Elf1
MIIKATCYHCGNTDTSQFKSYDGSMGYEAIVCLKCGSYEDSAGIHPADVWSKEFVRSHKES